MPPTNASETKRAARREHFIPLAPRDLLANLAGRTEFLPGERDAFETFARRLDAVLAQECQQRLNTLKTTYADFDPDADTVSLTQSNEAEHQDRASLFCEAVQRLLERANYRRVDHEELHQAVLAQGASAVKLEIDLNAFHRLEVYVRGDVLQQCEQQRRLRLFAGHNPELPVYQRLAVVYHPKAEARFEDRVDARHVYVKLFKNIPHNDMELLVPGSHIRMTLFDQGRIWLPTVSGLGLAAWKMSQGAVIWAMSSMWGLLGMLGFVGGTVGYGLRSYFGYQTAKDGYRLALTRNLFYQNLDNNAGALFRLLDDAREQEFREAILAYFLLWQNPTTAGRMVADLDQEAEALLQSLLGFEVDMETDDALAKLHRLRLAERIGKDGWRAVPLREAIRRLEATAADQLQLPTPHNGPPVFSVRRAA